MRFSITKGIKKFIVDWRELQRSMQPLPDPIDLIPKRPEIPWWKISPNIYYIAFRDTVKVYLLSLRDVKSAIKELERDEAIIRLKEEQYIKSKTLDPDNNDIKIDMDDVMRKVNEIIPKEQMNNPKDLLKYAYENKDNIKDATVDRLQVISQAIAEFMSGYKEGKQIGIKEVAEGKDFIRVNLPGILENEINKQPTDNSTATTSTKTTSQESQEVKEEHSDSSANHKMMMIDRDRTDSGNKKTE